MVSVTAKAPLLRFRSAGARVDGWQPEMRRDGSRRGDRDRGVHRRRPAQPSLDRRRGWAFDPTIFSEM